MLLNCDAVENSWESLGLQGDQPVNPKENQPWIFTGRINAEAEAPILWPPDVKSPLIGKVPDAGKGWGKGKRQQKMRWLDSITSTIDMNLSRLGERGGQGAWCAAVHGFTESDKTVTEQWQNATKQKDPVGQCPLPLEVADCWSQTWITKLHLSELMFFWGSWLIC